METEDGLGHSVILCLAIYVGPIEKLFLVCVWCITKEQRSIRSISIFRVVPKWRYICIVKDCGLLELSDV